MTEIIIGIICICLVVSCFMFYAIFKRKELSMTQKVFISVAGSPVLILMGGLAMGLTLLDYLYKLVLLLGGVEPSEFENMIHKIAESDDD